MDAKVKRLTRKVYDAVKNRTILDLGPKGGRFEAVPVVLQNGDIVFAFRDLSQPVLENFEEEDKDVDPNVPTSTRPS